MTKCDFNLLWRGRILTPALFPCRERLQHELMSKQWRVSQMKYFRASGKIPAVVTSS